MTTGHLTGDTVTESATGVASSAGGPTAWFHCFCGIAGDMAMGALVDAGAELDEVRALCRRLPVGGWTLEAEAVLRGGVAATKVHVGVEETTVVRTAAHITGLIEEARLPDRLRDRALAVFGALAEVEGQLHRRPPSQVHFHEVGSLDAIIDVVGTCAALEVLDVVRRSVERGGHRPRHAPLEPWLPAQSGPGRRRPADRRTRPTGSTSASS